MGRQPVADDDSPVRYEPDPDLLRWSLRATDVDVLGELLASGW
jgi:hypothetical protein